MGAVAFPERRACVGAHGRLPHLRTSPTLAGDFIRTGSPAIFDYGRDEVRSFLISSALFWLDKYHADGIRVDAVSSMVYLDYSRPPGEWTPNEHGGRENLEALRFLRELNEAVYLAFPDAQTIAEESTAWPRVSRPTYADGLGFGMKWDMGWMNDTLRYFQPRAGSQKASSSRAYVPSDVCILREFHAIAFPRRGGLRQGVSA